MIIDDMTNWVSPGLGIRFEWNSEGLRVYYPDGRPFLTTIELARQAEELTRQVEQEKHRADYEKQRGDRLAEQLRQLGIEPRET